MLRIAVFLTVVALIGTLPNSNAQERGSIAVIGTGDMGDSLGPRFAKLGYRVTYGSRDPARRSVQELVRHTGPGTNAASQQEAAKDADIVVLAVPWPPMERVAQNLGNLDGKIVIDISTTGRQSEDGYMESMVETSSAEMIQKWNPGAKVVKTMLASSAVIDEPMAFGERISTFIAADDREAKEVVAQIAYDLGLIPIDAGPLRNAREIEAVARLWYVPILQRRSQEWELALRPANYWSCQWQDDWTESVSDKDDLSQFPEVETNLRPCSSWSQED